MTIKAVLFDLDDTLYSDFDTCDQLGMDAAGRYAAETIGIPAHKAAEAMRSGRMMLRDTSRDEPESHDRVLFAKLGLESIGINPIPYAEGMHEAYWNAVLDHMVIREGVLDLLTRLKAAGGRDKPHPEIFQLAPKRLGTQAEETLMVGDNLNHDVRGALSAGLPALWLNWKHKNLPFDDGEFLTAFTFPEAAAEIAHLCGL